MMEFDELPPFDEEDTSRQEVTLARQERIAAARRAATSYTAKIEEAQWFNASAYSGKDKTARPALFALQFLYFEKEYATVVDQGLALLSDESVLEEVEILDMILRASLKLGKSVTGRPGVLEIAARWRIITKNAPGYTFTAAEVYSQAGDYPNAAEACLAAIIARGRLSPYVTLLDHIFLKWSPAALSASDYHRMRHWSNRPTTDQAQELESAVRLLQLSQPAKEALVNILKRQEEREEEVLRDVRSL